VVVRVTVEDRGTSAELIRLLVQEIDARKLCFEPERGQVLIEVGKDPDRTLVQILNVVEAWLGDGGREPTNVEIDGHTYVLGSRPETRSMASTLESRD
jgi:hypothetical protein